MKKTQVCEPPAYQEYTSGSVANSGSRMMSLVNGQQAALPQAVLSQSQARLARLIADVKPPPYEMAAAHAERFSPTRGSTRVRNHLERAWTDWIHPMAAWTMMVTLTFRRSGISGFKVTETAVQIALERLLRLINCDLFGKRRTNKGWTIAHAVTVDWGAYGDHPHGHLLLTAPDGVADRQLCAVVERAARRIRIVNRERRYKQYYSAGGTEYLIDHGTDRMVVSLIAPAHQGR
jgi:hypothetical protein